MYVGEWKRYQNGAPYYTDIAIKIVRDQTLIDNAWDEAHKMNELDHQNILMIYGVCNHREWKTYIFSKVNVEITSLDLVYFLKLVINYVS